MAKAKSKSVKKSEKTVAKKDLGHVNGVAVKEVNGSTLICEDGSKWEHDSVTGGVYKV